MSLSFIVPAYNSSKTINKVIDEIKLAISYFKTDYEIIIIDDCSIDNTYELVQSIKKKNTNVLIIRNNSNEGFCKSFFIGVKNSNKEYVIYLPSTNVINSKQISKIISLIPKYDFVLVNYENQKNTRNLSRYIISNLFNFSINLFFFNNIKYFNGTNIYKTVLLEKINISSSSYVFQSELVLKILKQSKNYIECSVKLNDIKSKDSFFFSYKNIWNNITDYVRLVTRISM